MADLGLGALANFAAFLPDADPTSVSVDCRSEVETLVRSFRKPACGARYH